MKSTFFVLEGPDGAGKTTIGRAVAAALADRGLQFISRRQTSTTSEYTAALQDHLAQMLWHSGDAPDLPDHFWAHLQAAWFTAHEKQVIAPALADGPVIVDGWTYKLASKLAGQGWSDLDIDALFDRIRPPDHVILLNVAATELWERRSHDLRPAELGMHGDYEQLGRASFIDYQDKGRAQLLEMAARDGWTVIDIPAGESVEETTARVAAAVTDRLDGHQPKQHDYQWPHIDLRLRTTMDRQLHRSLSDRDGRGVIGEFEKAFAAFVGTRHALAFSSGTSALHAMCVAAGLTEQDEVIAPAYTFFATATPFAYEGVNVVFADADEFGNLDPVQLPHLVTDRTKAVLVTHMWGNPCRMDEIKAFCDAHGLLLLEDCSHAHFASWHGRRVGTWGDMAVFSNNQKAITTGEGGVLVTDADRYRELALLHSHYNKRCYQELAPASPLRQYALTGMGLKNRSTTLSAAMGLDQLAKADRIEARRREVVDAFRTILDGNPVVSPLVVDPTQGQHGLYVMGLRFHPDAATVTAPEFEARLVAAGAAYDIPGSTGVIADEPLFHRPDRNTPWNAPINTSRSRGHFPGAETFIGTFLKTFLWGYPGDEEAVAHHLSVLARTSAEVAR